MTSVLVPPNYYQQVITIISDLNLSKPPDLEMPDNPSIGNQETLHHKLSTCKGICIDDLIDSVYPPDTKLTFFRDQMGWNDIQIQRHHNDALIFFRDAFGLDFSKGYNLGGSIAIPGGVLRPYTFNSSMNETCSIISDSNVTNVNITNINQPTNNICSVQRGIVFSGGYLVKVNSMDLLARGIYGGSGKILPPDSVILYGYILANNQNTSQPLQWYHIHSLTPIQLSIDKAWTIKSEIIAFGTDSWGRMDGMCSIEQRTSGSDFHLAARQVVTFPGRLI